MPAYLLDCPCGKTLTVDSSLAGGKIKCDACGKDVDVPSFRGLKELPLAAPEPAGKGSKEVSAPKEGNVTRNLGSLIMLFSVVALTLLIVFRFRAITGYTAEDAISYREQQIDSLDPVETWELWGEMSRFGLGSRDQMGLPAIEARRVKVMYILMGVVLIIGAVGAVMFVKGAKGSGEQRPTG